ncbi:hypothetical protein DFJ74DRAFT_673523 [Hyaloraphidium curvatum]|nr:hypothetical protein DFJ74DRAFT_673523 [Hyaloraphidium curvatum]
MLFLPSVRTPQTLALFRACGGTHLDLQWYETLASAGLRADPTDPLLADAHRPTQEQVNGFWTARRRPTDPPGPPFYGEGREVPAGWAVAKRCAAGQCKSTGAGNIVQQMWARYSVAPEKLRSCAKCRSVAYCSAACQRFDWGTEPATEVSAFGVPIEGPLTRLIRPNPLRAPWRPWRADMCHKWQCKLSARSSGWRTRPARRNRRRRMSMMCCLPCRADPPWMEA